MPGRGGGAVTEQVEQMDEISAAVLMKSELLAGEALIRSVGANVLLPLHPGAGGTDAPPYVLGASAPRKVLGMLHLTNYRLKFKPADRAEPAFTILLPAIADVRDVSFLFVRKFRLTMQDGTFIEFLKWGIPSFIASINVARARSDKLDWDAIRRESAAAQDKLGAWSVMAG